MTSEAWAVVGGAVLGAFLPFTFELIKSYIASNRTRKLEKLQKTHLIKCLKGADNNGWMSIKMLAQVIGADLDTTRMLLIECEARGSMKIDKEMWSLISRNPLPKIEE
jgi:hypothetical protein